MKKSRISTKLSVALLVSATLSVATAQTSSYRQTARQILDTAGIKGGLVVHIGCGDGRLTVALRAGDTYSVQGLEAKGKNIRKAWRRQRKYFLNLDLKK